MISALERRCAAKGEMIATQSEYIRVQRGFIDRLQELLDEERADEVDGTEEPPREWPAWAQPSRFDKHGSKVM